MKRKALLAAVFWPLCGLASAPKEISGIYPSLAMFNEEGECGTGAVVPWAGSLWALTYAPHAPYGSSDKLYEITADLKQIVRPDAIQKKPSAASCEHAAVARKRWDCFRRTKATQKLNSPSKPMRRVRALGVRSKFSTLNPERASSTFFLCGFKPAGCD